MIINENILQAMGAEIENYNISENIFSEGDNPNHYYQILEGKVKLNNYN